MQQQKAAVFETVADPDVSSDRIYMYCLAGSSLSMSSMDFSYL